MNIEILKKYKDKIFIAIVILICIIGFLVRLIGTGEKPNALNVDETSAGYEAFSILNYGIDRNGNKLPVFLVAWGSGQNALLSYLIIPFIKIVGLSALAIRLPMAILGCISLVVFYCLLKRITNRKIALIGLAFLAICPWHIMKSRWGLESNLFPDIVLLAIFLLVKGLQDNKRWIYYISFVFFGLTAYAYGTSYFFLPLFLIPVLIILVKRKDINVKKAILSLIIVGIISLPIIIFVIINTFDLPQINLPFMTIPRMTVNRYEEVTSIFSSEFLSKSINNFTGSLNVLIKQVDGLGWNSIYPYGTIYIFSTIFTIIGIVFAIKNRKDIKYGFLFGTWGIVSIVLTFICEPNINRLNILMFPMIFYTVIGIYEVVKHGKVLIILVSILYAVSFGMFINAYIKEDEGNYWTFEKGLEQPIEYVDSLEDKQIYVTNKIKEPYIYVLFYTEYNTEDFVNTVEYRDPTVAFREVISFGKYHFQEIKDIDASEENVYLIEKSELENLDTTNFKITEFDGYVVLEGEKAE